MERNDINYIQVNEPELIANGGGAQVALKNITSRFDYRYSDGSENCQILKVFNGKHVTGMFLEINSF